MPPKVLRVAVPAPLRKLFDYLPPEGTDPSGLQPGVRVSVPFAGRQLTGILVALTDYSEIPGPQLKTAEAVLDEVPLLSPAVFALCRWAAEYYLHPPGEVFHAAFPAWLRSGREAAFEHWAPSPRAAGLPPGAPRRAPRQAALLEWLRSHGPASAATLRAAGFSPATLRALRKDGLLSPAPPPQAPPTGPVEPALPLNGEQAAALALLEGAQGFAVALLDGVTGSGKTEVYLQRMASCLRAGQQVLVLVPEIGLTPQTVERIRRRFTTPVALLHSGMADGDRARAWLNAARGGAGIVVGTRSAVFTPLPKLGLIVVDEEHDSALRQHDGFAYSARDLAVKRGQLEQCPVILASATPALESLHNAQLGRYRHLKLRQRAGPATPPAVDIVDLRDRPVIGGLGERLLEAVDQTLRGNRQVLLFLNRRGYAPTLQCHGCGWVGHCAHCDARLTVHQAKRKLQCHHCGHARALPRRCPDCHSDQLLTAGLGTEQAEAHLRAQFPGYPVLRVDSDTISGRVALEQLLARVQQGQACILIGTQMLAKGHHFPAVALVGVVDADALLFSADFRGEEKLAQLLTQVAGRAGRAGEPGRVLVQTHHPQHPLLLSVLQNGYANTAEHLLASRRHARLPPLGRLLTVRADGRESAVTEAFLQQLRKVAENRLPRGCRLIGPLPAVLARRAGRYRFQLLCLCDDPEQSASAGRVLVQAAEALPRPRRDPEWRFERDPVDSQ